MIKRSQYLIWSAGLGLQVYIPLPLLSVLPICYKSNWFLDWLKTHAECW